MHWLTEDSLHQQATSLYTTTGAKCCGSSPRPLRSSPYSEVRTSWEDARKVKREKALKKNKQTNRQSNSPLLHLSNQGVETMHENTSKPSTKPLLNHPPLKAAHHPPPSTRVSFHDTNPNHVERRPVQSPHERQTHPTQTRPAIHFRRQQQRQQRQRYCSTKQRTVWMPLQLQNSVHPVRPRTRTRRLDE